jgi:hypothetical protein
MEYSDTSQVYAEQVSITARRGWISGSADILIA